MQEIGLTCRESFKEYSVSRARSSGAGEGLPALREKKSTSRHIYHNAHGVGKEALE